MPLVREGRDALHRAAGEVDELCRRNAVRLSPLAVLGREVVRWFAGCRRDELSRPQEQPTDSSVKCPCIWKVQGTSARPMSIPRYNNENRWYIEKYQSIVSLFE